MTVGGQKHAPAAYARPKDPVLIVQEAGKAPGPGRTSAKNVATPRCDPRNSQPVASRYTKYTKVVQRDELRHKYIFQCHSETAGHI